MHGSKAAQQIAPEGRASIMECRVRCSQPPNVHLLHPRRAERCDTSVLHNTQKLGLGSLAEAADLIKEKRSSVGSADLTLLRASRSA